MKSMKRKILQIIGFAAVIALFTAGCNGCRNGGGGESLSVKTYTYTVSYDANGAFDANGDEVKPPPPQTVEEGEDITLDSIGGEEYPFIFKFWTEAQTDTAGRNSRHLAGKSYTVTKDITLYAQWDSAYAVVFNANGGTGKAPSPQKQVYGGSITLPDDGGLTKSGNIFYGWSVHSGGSANTYGAGEAYTVSGNDTLYALWIAEPESIDVGDMVAAAGGTFMMGGGGVETEVGDFLIGKREVTQKLWRDVMGNNPSEFKGDNLPVENVTWNDVQVFFDSLESKRGKRYRLPTEEEWEYAARGGDKSQNYLYSGSDDVKDVAVYGDSEPASVGSKKANELGLYDMSGNVWEWVEDESHIDPNKNNRRIIRGGGWSDPDQNCTVTRRRDWERGNGYKDIGFRLAGD